MFASSPSCTALSGVAWRLPVGSWGCPGPTVVAAPASSPATSSWVPLKKKLSYTAKWSSGYTDMQSSLDQEAKSSKTAKWSSGTL